MIVTNWFAKMMVAIGDFLVPGSVQAGMTIWPFIFIDRDKTTDHLKLIQHEQVHLKQWKRYWVVGFPFIYVHYWIKYGYWNNPFEREARGEGYASTFV